MFMPYILPMKFCQYPFIYLEELPLFTFLYKPTQYTLNTKWLCQKNSLIPLPLGGGEDWRCPRKSRFMFAMLTFKTKALWIVRSDPQL